LNRVQRLFEQDSYEYTTNDRLPGVLGFKVHEPNEELTFLTWNKVSESVYLLCHYISWVHNGHSHFDKVTSVDTKRETVDFRFPVVSSGMPKPSLFKVPVLLIHHQILIANITK